MAQDEKNDPKQLVSNLAGRAITSARNTAQAELPLGIFFGKVHARAKELHWAWFASFGAVILLAALFCTLAYRGTFVLGKVQVVNMAFTAGANDKQMANRIDQTAGKYTFSVTAPGAAAQTYSLKDAGISVNSAASVADARQAIRDLNWQRFMWWRTTTVPLTVVKNHKQFNDFVAAHIAIANKAATDASISASTGQAVITDGSDGWTYALPGGNQSIATSASTLKPLHVTLTKATVKPALKSVDLASAKTKIDAYLQHNITFTMADKTYAPTAKNVGSWLDIDPAPAHKTVDVSVNSGKVQAYLDSATKGDIFPARAQINITNADGSVSVLSAGQNGQTITNKTAVVKAVTDQLQGTTPDIHADLAVSYQAFSTINAADYPKWIVVDLTGKRMYAYEHGTLVRSFLVSAGAPKTPTVVGTYQIYSKYVSKDMRGSNADGSRYFQPHVHYVNFFYKDYAIHGNYWRPTSYFGNINSSHGCVGITDSDAEWVYNWAPIGTTVITHN